MGNAHATTALRAMLVCAAGAGALATGLQAGPARAAESPKDDSGTSVSEVLVTARKREERLVDVPIAASVLSGDDIRQRGVIADPGLLLSQVPGVQFNNTGAPSTSEISIRGSGTARGTTADSGLGLYRNGVYVAGGLQFGRNFYRADLFDPERVEILRGTQGALYGRNAVGGAINIISARPAFEDTGWLDLEYNTTRERVTAQAVLNHKVSDEVAVRLGVDYTDERKGFFRNIDYDRYQDLTSGYVLRGQVRFRRDKLDADLLVETQQLATPGVPSQLVIPPTPPNFPKGFTTPRRDFYSSIPGKNYLNVDNYILNVAYDFGWATLSSTSAYRHRRGGIINDNDLFSAQSLALARAQGNPAATTDIGVIRSAYDHTDTLYQEAHLTGEFGAATWLAGFDYMDLKSDFELADTRTPTAANKSLGNDSHTHQDYRSGAVYAALGYDFTSQWNLTGELRYTDDKRNFTSFTNQISTSILVISPFTRDANGTSLDHNITLRFKPWQSVMFYLKEGTGYRVGGVNGSNAPPAPPALKAVPPSYDNEDSRTFEAGMKATFMRSLYIGAAAYKTKVRNALALDNNGCSLATCGVQVTNFVTNSGTEDIYGVELETDYRFRLLDGNARLRVSGSRQYGKFKSGIYKGISTPQTPDYIANASINYVLPLADGFYGFANVNYRGQWGGVQDVSLPLIPMENREIVDLRGGVRHGPWEVSAFVDNVDDQEYKLFQAATTARWNSDLRQFGVQVRYSW